MAKIIITIDVVEENFTIGDFSKMLDYIKSRSRINFDDTHSMLQDGFGMYNFAPNFEVALQVD